ncbi:MAG: S1C family serine protease [Oligosphaeraceae bacterium]
MEMKSRIPIAKKYSLEETERLPASLGIILEDSSPGRYVKYWDFFWARVYTNSWVRNKLVELGNNYFIHADIVDRIHRDKYDYFLKFSDSVSFYLGDPIRVDMNLKLYDSTGRPLERFTIRRSGYTFTYPWDIHAYAILEGCSLLLLSPIVIPAANYSLAKTVEKQVAVAKNEAFSSAFEEIYEFLSSSWGSESISRASSGTGFAISPEYILTAYHVIEDASKIEVRFPNGEWKMAEVVENAANMDVALLRIQDKQQDWIPLPVSTTVDVGERIFTFGFPLSSMLGEESKFSEGVLNAQSGIQGDKTQYQISIPIQPGNSGGPVVCESGQVIGVITSSAASAYFYKRSHSLPQNINWATKLTSIRSLFGVDRIFPEGNLPTDREELIKKVKAATCKIRVESANRK